MESRGTAWCGAEELPEARSSAPADGLYGKAALSLAERRSEPCPPVKAAAVSESPAQHSGAFARLPEVQQLLCTQSQAEMDTTFSATLQPGTGLLPAPQRNNEPIGAPTAMRDRSGSHLCPVVLLSGRVLENNPTLAKPQVFAEPQLTVLAQGPVVARGAAAGSRPRVAGGIVLAVTVELAVGTVPSRRAFCREDAAVELLRGQRTSPCGDLPLRTVT